MLELIFVQELQLLIEGYDDFTFDIPELTLLRCYHHDAMSWKSRANQVLANIDCREDQENVVDELTSIQRDGVSLKVRGIFPAYGFDFFSFLWILVLTIFNLPL